MFINCTRNSGEILIWGNFGKTVVTPLLKPVEMDITFGKGLVPAVDYDRFKYKHDINKLGQYD